jgi:hypothetical protein
VTFRNHQLQREFGASLVGWGFLVWRLAVKLCTFLFKLHFRLIDLLNLNFLIIADGLVQLRVM